MREDGKTEDNIRRDLKALGKKTARISQLLSATRQVKKELVKKELVKKGNAVVVKKELVIRKDHIGFDKRIKQETSVIDSKSKRPQQKRKSLNSIQQSVAAASKRSKAPMSQRSSEVTMDVELTPTGSDDVPQELIVRAMIWPSLEAKNEVSANAGMLLPHMRLPPLHFDELHVASDTQWEQPLTVPPDGLCMIYSWFAAKVPAKWSLIPRSPQGFIQDRGIERLLIDEAKLHLGMIASAIRSSASPAASRLAQVLESGAHPGDEELEFYAAHFKTSILVIPEGIEHACPMIHGHGPIGFAVKTTWSAPNENGRRSGHFTMLRSWISSDSFQIEGLDTALQHAYLQVQPGANSDDDSDDDSQDKGDAHSDVFTKASDVPVIPLGASHHGLQEPEQTLQYFSSLAQVHDARWQTEIQRMTEDSGMMETAAFLEALLRKLVREHQSSLPLDAICDIIGMLSGSHTYTDNYQAVIDFMVAELGVDTTSDVIEMTLLSTELSREDPKQQDEHFPNAVQKYEKPLPFMDLPDWDFLEDVKTTQWEKHREEILRRSDYVCRILSRLQRLDPTQYHSIVKELEASMGMMTITILKQLQQTIEAKDALLDNLDEDTRNPEQHDTAADDVFANQGALMTALLPGSTVCITEHLLQKFHRQDGSLDEALAAIHAVGGERVLHEQIETMQDALSLELRSNLVPTEEESRNDQLFADFDDPNIVLRREREEAGIEEDLEESLGKIVEAYHQHLQEDEQADAMEKDEQAEDEEEK